MSGCGLQARADRPTFCRGRQRSRRRSRVPPLRRTTTRSSLRSRWHGRAALGARVIGGEAVRRIAIAAALQRGACSSSCRRSFCSSLPRRCATSARTGRSSSIARSAPSAMCEAARYGVLAAATPCMARDRAAAAIAGSSRCCASDPARTLRCCWPFRSRSSCSSPERFRRAAICPAGALSRAVRGRRGVVDLETTANPARRWPSRAFAGVDTASRQPARRTSSSAQTDTRTLAETYIGATVPTARRS